MNPACAVCTVAIGASIGIARRLGVEDAVIALWFGALMTIGGFWLIKWFDKNNWHFKFRNCILMLSSLSSIIPMYFGVIEYQTHPDFYLDIFLVAYILGGLIFVAVEKIYHVIKTKRGRAHFPFEKVVLPIATLIAVSFVLNAEFIAKTYILYLLFVSSLIAMKVCDIILSRSENKTKKSGKAGHKNVKNK
ncbi:MAG: hypothetical protein LBU68_02470 [Rickettsiales bacterium]|jgi:hypothetical protein|nr:hypothetical protein [Rickettsiales bacterium]